jgi:drug/metabolite transporter (DMT)-like permease
MKRIFTLAFVLALTGAVTPGAMLVLGKSWLTDRVYSTLLGACGAIILLLGGVFLFIAIRLLWRTPRATTGPA